MESIDKLTEQFNLCQTKIGIFNSQLRHALDSETRIYLTKKKIMWIKRMKEISIKMNIARAINRENEEKKRLRYIFSHEGEPIYWQHVKFFISDLKFNTKKELKTITINNKSRIAVDKRLRFDKESPAWIKLNSHTAKVNKDYVQFSN